MNDADFQVGRIFTVPLLGGGYAFGYLTYYRKGKLPLVDIFDHVSDESTPPRDIASKPVLLRDMFVGAEFILTPKHKAGERWRFTKETMPGPVKPHNRYYRMGSPPRSFKRIDILGEEPDVPLSPEEAQKYPTVGNSFAPAPTAQIEVAAKRLLMSPADLVKAWRERKPSN